MITTEMRKQWALIAAAIFTLALVTAGGFLIFDAFYRAPLQHALMNVEGIIALSFLAVLCTRARRTGAAFRAGGFKGLEIALLIAAVALAFIPILHTPFLYDDYTHITDASQSTWRSAAMQFGPVSGRGLFFRPLGFFLYWLNYLWAGANPTLWHAGNIAMHAVCCVLVYLLCRELGISRFPALAGALLFGLSGVSAEAVAWVDAGFVLLTTAFVLISLVAVCRYAETSKLAWLTAALIAGACAMLCKETAFCLPFLIASLALFTGRRYWNRIGRAAIFATGLTAALFAYRWWALHGIGGYLVSGGEPNVLHFNLVRTVDALFLRQWAVLFFPFNWAIPSGPMLRSAVAGSPFLLAAYALVAAPPRRGLIGCIAFILGAALPVQHLLLISPDLSGSRTLYLGYVGLGVFWAFILETTPRIPSIALAAVFLAIQCSMLEHNLKTWRETSELARSVCVAFGQRIAGTNDTVLVRGLPSTRNGAVFLRNGFPQCVEMNSGVPGWRIEVSEADAKPGQRVFRWDESSARMLP